MAYQHTGYGELRINIETAIFSQLSLVSWEIKCKKVYMNVTISPLTTCSMEAQSRNHYYCYYFHCLWPLQCI